MRGLAFIGFIVLIAHCNILRAEGTRGAKLPDEYLIILNDSADPDAFEQKHDLGKGNRNYRYQKVFKGFAAKLNASLLEKIKNDPDVRLIEQDQVFTADTAVFASSWGLDRIDQRSLPMYGFYNYEYQGSGVTAYIIDTGINKDHSDFGNRASVGYDALGGNGVDCNGHGTHVAGTVGGTLFGVAKGVNLVGVRVLDCSGSGSTSSVVAGMDWVAENHAAKSVVNMSLGGGASSILDAAVLNLFSSGVTTVVAAGNSNVDACGSSPARAPEAITVAASDVVDARASFSNFGSCVDLFAPGVNITSAWFDGTVKTISGTSMASPHVAGVAALYLEQFPTATPIEVNQGIVTRTTKNVVKVEAKLANTTTKQLLYALPGDPPPPPPADTTKPQVSIVSPTAGAIVLRGKSQVIEAVVTDDVGVRRTEFRVSDKLLCTFYAAPWTCSWNVPQKPNASYVIKVTAFDPAGNQSTVQASVKSSP